MAVACGYNHTIVIAKNGSVFGFGNTSHGKLGIGDTPQNSNEPKAMHVLVPLPVRQVAAGFRHTGIVTDAGDLFMCGWGEYGRLGLGDEEDRTTPTLVGRAVLMVACGANHTAAVTEGGGVYTFGCGEYGRLGHGDEEHQLAPRQVPAAGFNGERVVMVAAGFAHTVALSEAGHVFTWGLNNFGQLGHNDTEDQWAPRQVEPGRFGGEKVVFVAARSVHTVAVTAGGRLYTWGCGYYGRLGHGDTGRRLVPTMVWAGAFGRSAVVMAACGALHTLVVTQDGGLWACGLGFDGRLGLNDEEDMHLFERVAAGAFGGARVVAAAAGEKHSAAVTEDGKLWTWGSDESGQLGRGEHAPLSCGVPRCVDTTHSQDIKKMLLRSSWWNTLPDDVQKKIFIMSMHWTGKVKLPKN